MASKKPLKAAKPAAKTASQLNKAQVAKKAAGKKEGAPEKPKAKAAAKPVKPPLAKATKKAKPAKKEVKLAPNVAKKAAKVINPVAKLAPVKKAAANKATKKTEENVKKASIQDKTKPGTKAAVSKKQAKEKEPVVAKAAAKAATSLKPIIVPPKPAINPKPAPAKKSEKTKASKPVAIPKTSTDKKVAYEPEFTKSVLDTVEYIPNLGPTMRYNDSDLVEFRELINKKLDAAKKELGYLQGLITRKDEMGGDESDNRYMTMEDGSMSMEREQLSQMASRQIIFIDHLEKAIMRIENKTYGICRVTGKLIDKARLRAVPHATLSMEAKMGINK